MQNAEFSSTKNGLKSVFQKGIRNELMLNIIYEIYAMIYVMRNYERKLITFLDVLNSF